jgi:transcriptional regulator with XRE-family HTH domain
MGFKRCQTAIAKNLKSLRSKAGLSQSEVSKRTKIPFRYYQEIEGARVNVTLKTLIRLSTFFKVTLSKLVNGCACGPVKTIPVYSEDN